MKAAILLIIAKIVSAFTFLVVFLMIPDLLWHDSKNETPVGKANEAAREALRLHPHQSNG